MMRRHVTSGAFAAAGTSALVASVTTNTTPPAMAAMLVARRGKSSSSSAPPLFPRSPYDRDAIDQFEGFDPEAAFCGRFATVAKQPHSSSDSSSGGAHGSGGEGGSSRYLVEHGTLLGRGCALGNAIEQDLRRIRYDLFDKRQMRFAAKTKNAAQSKSGASEGGSSKTAANSSVGVIRNGSSAYIMQPVKQAATLLRTLRGTNKGPNSSTVEDALTLASDAADKHTPFLNQQQLNYYYRMNFTPKRHVVIAAYMSLWNTVCASTTAAAALLTVPLHYAYMAPSEARPVTRDMVCPSGNGGSSVFGRAAYAMASSNVMPVRAAYGVYRALRAVALYTFLAGVVSPAIHFSQALANMPFGIYNAVAQPRYTFDSCDGLWIRHSVPDCAALSEDMVERMQRMMCVGRREAYARKIAGEVKWKDHLGKLGIGRAGANAATSDDPYEILNVGRDATPQQIKQSYQKLAKIHHPDVSASAGLTEKEKEEGRAKFESVSTAYKMLSNPETRRMYDRGGKKAVEMQQGAVLVGSSGDVMERVFGGIYFRETLCGMHFRSHWHMKFQFQCCVSIAELDEMQSMQMRLVAAKLAAMLDVHAKDPTIGPFIHLGTRDPLGAAENMMKVATTMPSNEANKAKPNPFDTKKRSPQGNGKGGASNINKGAGSTNKSSSNSTAAGAGAPASDAASNTTTGGTAAAAVKAVDPLVYIMTCPPTDAEFSMQFRQRAQKFVAKLATACFGRELLYELGLAYTTSAKAYLGSEGTSYYAPKKLQWRKNFSGIERLIKQFKMHVSEKSKEEMQQLAAVEFFSMEWDNVCLDTHVQARFSSQLVIWSEDGDAVVSPNPLPNSSAAAAAPKTPTNVSSDSLRYKRLRALWYVGQLMLKEGSPWDQSDRANDKDLIEYFKRSAKGGMDVAPLF